MIIYKCLDKNLYSEHIDEVVNFYQSKYKKPFMQETVLNSSMIGIAMEDKKVVGAVRVLTDFSRHAFIVDMIVEEGYRKQGIGTKLIRVVTEELNKSSVWLVSLATDPKNPALVEFYKKCGFEPLEGSVYMRSNGSST